MSVVHGREGASRRPWRNRAALAIVVILGLAIPALAIRSPGFHAAQMNLDDGGVWVTNGDRGLIGRINTQIGRLEVALTAPGSFDIAQHDDTVMVDLATSHELATIDVAQATLGRPTKVPDNATSTVGGRTAALSDEATGKVWVTDRSRAGQLDPAAAPAVEAGAGTGTAVGTDGTAWSYADGRNDMVANRPGVEPRSVPLPFPMSRAEVSAVGDEPLILEPDSGRLVLPGGRVVELGRDKRPRLQQPGPAHDEILVATDDELLAVSVHDGSTRTLARGTGGAVAPVWLDDGAADALGAGHGCAFAAWASRPTWAQICPGRDDRGGAVKARAGANLELRVNRNRVVLNDVSTGFSLLFTADQPVEIDNWRDVLPPDQGPQPEEKIVQKPKDDCDPTRFDAEVNPDEKGTRMGRAVIVDVLDNDRFPSCQVPVVSVPDPPRHEVADVAVVEEGTAVQVTPAPGRTDPVTFSYVVAVGSRTYTSSVRVTIVDRSRNSPPKAVTDTTTVVAGRTVRHNVLANDSDPDGDALMLVGVRLAGEGTATYQSGGEVAYTAPGGISGEQAITYTVADELGATATGTLKVVVTPEGVNVGPTARNDRREVIVGRATPVPVLANDADPNGDPLSISDVTPPADLDVRRGDGELIVTARRAGSFTFPYTISDGEAQAQGWVRIDARNPAGNHPPVAVRDELVVRPGVPAPIDVTRNDIDADGDVLAVTGVSSPNAYLSVVTIDQHIVQVTAPAGFSDPVDVRYTVTDGPASSEGVLIVRPFDQGRVDQAPVVTDDEQTVKAGNVTAIHVLDNDVDPEGERLRLVAVADVPPDQGQIFIQNDQLRFQAPAGGARTVRTSYTVMDPGGNRADGLVTLRVVPDDQPNRPPTAPLIEARAFAGAEITIPVTLTGLDPDGDVVTIVGISDRDGDQPAKGHARVMAGGFRYRADRGAAGTDAFGFVVRDAGGLEATGRVRVAVVPRPATNSPPVAAPDRITVRAGATVPVPVLDNDSDPDGDPLTLLTAGKDAPTQPRGAHVTAAPEGGDGLVLAVDPTASAGDVSFAYTVSDGRGGSARGIVTVTVTTTDPADAPPLARDDVVDPQSPGGTVDVDVLANDRDPDGATNRLRVAVVSAPEGVTTEVLGDQKLRVHLGDRSVALVYSVTDPAGISARAVVSIPVLANRPPVCDLGSAEVRAGDDVAVDVRSLCRDPEGARLAVARLLGGVRGGTARLDGDKVVFTAAPEVPGDAGFEVLVTDGSATAVAGVVVKVIGRNFPPVLAASNIELPAGAERTVDLDALVTDLNSDDRHTFSNLRGGTADINVSLSGSILRVRAADAARGATAQLSVTVSDGANLVTGQLTVHVLRHDGQPPAAVDDTARTLQEQPVTIDVLANDIDPLGKGLTIIDVSTVHGAAAITGSTIRFTPAPGFFGEALLTYRVTDASRDTERSSAATVRVSVVGRPSRPGAPAGVPDNRQVRLTWGAAQPNGAPIDYYVVETDGGLRRQTPSTSLVFDGLTNGAAYRFRVAAHNEAVLSPDQLVFSDWSLPVIPDTKPGTPAPPKLAFGDRQVSVSWTAPPNEGTPIKNFQVRISGGGITDTRDVGLNLAYAWTGLTNGTQYNFSVRAENNSGFGEWSSPTNDPFNGIPAAKPGVVPGVSATRLNAGIAAGGTVQVNWGTPAANGDANFTFTVTIAGAGAPGPTVINDATARSTTVRGLRFGTAYTFSVTATNKAGTGPPGSSVATPAAEPAALAPPTATPGDRTVRLDAVAPANNGAGISGWQVSVNNQPFILVYGPTSIAPGTPFSVTVNALTNGQTYSFRLMACNDVGCSGPSGPSNAVRPFGNPDAPVVSARVEGATIIWNWNAVNGNGRDIVRYDLVVDGAPAGNTPGLEYRKAFPDGRQHTLKVVAVNEEGRTTSSNTSAATSQPPPVEVTTTGGANKDTFDDWQRPITRNPQVVPPDTVVHATCRVQDGPRWWYSLDDFGGQWLAGTDLTVPNDSRVRIC